MNLISTLNSGISAAANGWAEIYIRGTSTRATVWYDFEASTSDSSGDNIDLDAYGAVEVYVNQLVDVVAKSPDGTVVRSWTDGYSSPNIEVISPSFTGNDYVSGAAAVNEPTTLQAILNLWETNAGAPDWKVLIGSAATTLENAFGVTTGLVFNVKSPAYGAVGDGVTNDQGAIQAALADAVAAGGGTVYLPAGTYLVSTAIEWDHRVNLLGLGAWAVKVKTGSASNARILKLTTGTARNTPCIIAGIAFDASQTNTGEQFYSAVAPNIKFVGCEFGASNTCTGTLIYNFSGGGVMFFENCRFTSYAGYCAELRSNATFISCQFFAGTGTYNQELVRLDSTTGVIPSYYSLSNCTFDASAVTNAPSDLHGIRLASTIAYTSLSNCHFISTGQLFTSAVRLIGVGYAKVTGGSFTGCSIRYTLPGSVPAGSGSFLDVCERRRSTGAGAAFTVADCCDLQEIYSTGTAPTVTMPTMIYPSQRLSIYMVNDSGGNWASVLFAGTYTSLVAGATAVNNGQYIFLDCVVSDLLSSGTYRWHIVAVQVG